MTAGFKHRFVETTSVGVAFFLTLASSPAAQTNIHPLHVAPTATVGRTGVWRSGRVMLPVVTNTSNFAVVAHRGGTNFSPVPDSLTTVGGKSHIVVPTNT